MADRITIVDYDPQWPVRFEDERARLSEAFGDDAIQIDHIGSTAVPGLAAKPIIDIVVAARTFPLPGSRITAVEGLGYEHLGEYGIPGRAYFRRRSPRPRTHHCTSTPPGAIGSGTISCSGTGCARIQRRRPATRS